MKMTNNQIVKAMFSFVDSSLQASERIYIDHEDFTGFIAKQYNSDLGFRLLVDGKGKVSYKNMERSTLEKEPTIIKPRAEEINKKNESRKH
jgi:hypothetical protein